MKIEIFSTLTCPWCITAKKYFKDKNIDFVDYDVGHDPKRADEMVEISGQMGVPVIKMEIGTFPLKQTTSPRISFALKISVLSNM